MSFLQVVEDSLLLGWHQDVRPDCGQTTSAQQLFCWQKQSLATVSNAKERKLGRRHCLL